MCPPATTAVSPEEIPGSDKAAVEHVKSDDNKDYLYTFGCDLPKLKNWLQQIPGTSEIFIQKSEGYHIYTVIHIKIVHR